MSLNLNICYSDRFAGELNLLIVFSSKIKRIGYQSVKPERIYIYD